MIAASLLVQGTERGFKAKEYEDANGDVENIIDMD